MQLHHAVRIRLLSQRISVSGIISNLNCGMALHAMRQLETLNIKDQRLLKQLNEVIPQTDIRSKANILHCLSCCIREQHPIHEGLPELISNLLLKMQKEVLEEVDELSPTECILVMEGLVKLTPFKCVESQLAAILRNRSSSLIHVVNNSLELIGIARIVVEAIQESYIYDNNMKIEEKEQEYDYMRLSWSQELREISQNIESRLDSFSKQDLIALIDAITLRINIVNTNNNNENNSIKLLESKKSDERRIFRDVPEECRPLLLSILNRIKFFLPMLSSSQLNAWLIRIVNLRLQHHIVFINLVKRIDEDNIQCSMSLSQLSKCIQSLSDVLILGYEGDKLSLNDQNFISQVIVKLLNVLCLKLEKINDSKSYCSEYLIPTLLSLSENVSKGFLNISQTLMERLFYITLKDFSIITPRERAEIITALFHWGVLKKYSGTHRGKQQEYEYKEGIEYSNNNNKNKSETPPFFTQASWCNIIIKYIDSYNTLDLLQIINEVSAAVYADTAGNNEYDLSVIRPMLTQLHERAQETSLKNLNSVPTSHLARYLTSISKLGVRRKSDYYKVLNILHQRPLTDFEWLRVLGVIARHHLRAVEFISQSVYSIPQRTSLHSIQKCLLLKFLGQSRAQRFVRVPHHNALRLHTFLSTNEVNELPLLSAIFAFIGLIELRQFESEIIDYLLLSSGPITHSDGFGEILSAATLSELIAAFSRIEQHRVPTGMIISALEVAANRLVRSRSFFVDVTEICFWIRLVKERPSLDTGKKGVETTWKVIKEKNKNSNAQKHNNDDDYLVKEYTEAVMNYISVAGTIAKTRLLDIAESNNLRPNTFLFSQLAVGYQLGISIPQKIEFRLSQYLDTKHLPQLLSNPRHIINAVIVALHIWRINLSVAIIIFEFAIKNFGALSAQEVLILGIEVKEALHNTENASENAINLMKKLLSLAKNSLNDIQRQRKLSLQELSLGIYYGVVEDEKTPLNR